MARCSPGTPGRATAGVAVVAGALACAAADAASSHAAATPRTDAAVFAAIDRLRGAATALTVDGDAADWDPFPAFADPAGDAGGDPSRDVVRTAVAPTASALWVYLATAGAPATDDRAFWLDLDVTGHRSADLRVGLSLAGDEVVHVFEPDGSRRTVTAAFDVAIDSVIEARMPWALFEAILGPDRAVRGDAARSWVRVFPFTWDREADRFFDYGAAAASFRLMPTPYPLDPPLPQGPVAAELAFPLEDVWWVSQGPFGSSSHAEIWAYDLSRTDETLYWAPTRGTCSNEEYFAWDRPILSPAIGEVIRVWRGTPDTSPCENGEGSGNGVYVDLGTGAAVWLTHMRRGTVAVAPRDSVEVGQYLGRVGNSGRSSGAHLHIGLYDRSDDDITLPLAFLDVRVGLNPGVTDPWIRDFDRWEPREGFFVQRVPEESAHVRGNR